MERRRDNPESTGRRRLPPLLRRCWYGLNQAFRGRIAHLGLTPSQFTVLRGLAEAGDEGLTQNDLTEFMASDANTIAALIARMHQAGEVRCSTDPSDRRAKRVRLSVRGRRLCEQARPIALDLQRQALDVLPRADREKFLHDLELVADACQAALAHSRARPRD
jgi:DNA-binding MarR family transcriptional regulator